MGAMPLACLRAILVRMALPLALLKVGSTSPEIASERGDYDRWFREGLGVDDVETFHVSQGDSLPSPTSVRAVVVTGSFAMVTDRAAWSVASAEFLLECVERATPVLGVCYGHQLLADALGGVVSYNARGRQIGTVEARLTTEGTKDELLSGLGDPLVVQTSHRQHVLRLPPSAVLLASSPLDENHAFRVGKNAWGVQFHPEFDHEVARRYVLDREDALLKEGRDPRALSESVRASAHGRAILARFGAIAG